MIFHPPGGSKRNHVQRMPTHLYQRKEMPIPRPQGPGLLLLPLEHRKRPTPANQPYDPYSEPQTAVHALPALEDADAIQLTLSDVVLALAANQIDPRRARILIYGLQVASQNNRHRRVPQVREAEGAANLGLIVRETHKHEDGTLIGPEKQTPDPEEAAERTRPLTLGELLLRDAEALYGKYDAEGKQATESAPNAINIQATTDTSTEPAKACRALHSRNIEPCSRRQG